MGQAVGSELSPPRENVEIWSHGDDMSLLLVPSVALRKLNVDDPNVKAVLSGEKHFIYLAKVVHTFALLLETDSPVVGELRQREAKVMKDLHHRSVAIKVEGLFEESTWRMFPVTVLADHFRQVLATCHDKKLKQRILDFVDKVSRSCNGQDTLNAAVRLGLEVRTLEDESSDHTHQQFLDTFGIKWDEYEAVRCTQYPAAYRLMRSYVPVYVFGPIEEVEARMRRDGMPEGVIHRLLEQKLLWLLCMHPADLQNLPLSFLSSAASFQDLDIVELSALWSHIPMWTDLSRALWRSHLKQHVDKLIYQEKTEQGLADYIVRHPVYGDDSEQYFDPDVPLPLLGDALLKQETPTMPIKSFSQFSAESTPSPTSPTRQSSATSSMSMDVTALFVSVTVLFAPATPTAAKTMKDLFSDEDDDMTAPVTVSFERVESNGQHFTADGHSDTASSMSAWTERSPLSSPQRPVPGTPALASPTATPHFATDLGMGMLYSSMRGIFDAAAVAEEAQIARKQQQEEREKQKEAFRRAREFFSQQRSSHIDDTQLISSVSASLSTSPPSSTSALLLSLQPLSRGNIRSPSARIAHDAVDARAVYSHDLTGFFAMPSSGDSAEHNRSAASLRGMTVEKELKECDSVFSFTLSTSSSASSAESATTEPALHVEAANAHNASAVAMRTPANYTAAPAAQANGLERVEPMSEIDQSNLVPVKERVSVLTHQASLSGFVPSPMNSLPEAQRKLQRVSSIRITGNGHCYAGPVAGDPSFAESATERQLKRRSSMSAVSFQSAQALPSLQRQGTLERMPSFRWTPASSVEFGEGSAMQFSDDPTLAQLQALQWAVENELLAQVSGPAAGTPRSPQHPQRSISRGLSSRSLSKSYMEPKLAQIRRSSSNSSASGMGLRGVPASASADSLDRRASDDDDSDADEDDEDYGAVVDSTHLDDLLSIPTPSKPSAAHTPAPASAPAPAAVAVTVVPVLQTPLSTPVVAGRKQATGTTRGASPPPQMSDFVHSFLLGDAQKQKQTQVPEAAWLSPLGIHSTAMLLPRTGSTLSSANPPTTPRDTPSRCSMQRCLTRRRSSFAMSHTEDWTQEQVELPAALVQQLREEGRRVEQQMQQQQLQLQLQQQDEEDPEEELSRLERLQLSQSPRAAQSNSHSHSHSRSRSNTRSLSGGDVSVAVGVTGSVSVDDSVCLPQERDEGDELYSGLLSDYLDDLLHNPTIATGNEHSQLLQHLRVAPPSSSSSSSSSATVSAAEAWRLLLRAQSALLPAVLTRSASLSSSSFNLSSSSKSSLSSLSSSSASSFSSSAGLRSGGAQSLSPSSTALLTARFLWHELDAQSQARAQLSERDFQRWERLLRPLPSTANGSHTAESLRHILPQQHATLVK